MLRFGKINQQALKLFAVVCQTTEMPCFPRKKKNLENGQKTIEKCKKTQTTVLVSAAQLILGNMWNSCHESGTSF